MQTLAKDIILRYKGHYDSIVNIINKKCDQIGSTIPEKIDEIRCEMCKLKFKYANMRKNFQRIKTPMGSDLNLYQFLVQIYVWVSICLFMSTIASVIFRWTVTSVVAKVGSKISFTFLSLITKYFTVKKIPFTTGSFQERQMLMLGATIADSLFMATALNEVHLNVVEPPSFLICFILAVLCAYKRAYFGKQSRLYFLLLNVFASLAVCVIYYLPVIDDHWFVYFVWSIIMSCVAALDLHSKIVYFASNPSLEPVVDHHQAATIVALTSANFVAKWIFSFI